MKLITTCRDSGHRAGKNCNNTQEIYVAKSGLKTDPCPYHKLIHLDEKGRYRVNSDCEEINKMLHKSWFILPPIEEFYYKKRHPAYKIIPSVRNDCQSTSNSVSVMQIVYPKSSAKIYVPKELSGTLGKTIFEVAHRQNSAVVYWHIDDTYVGTTNGSHQLSLYPNEGMHVLTLVDDKGNTIQRKFEIISK